jgi:tRNA(Leu) C34 or U34 (ribose-2'-O)-methylase TrmL
LCSDALARDVASQLVQAQGDRQPLLAGHAPIRFELTLKRGCGIHAGELRPCRRSSRYSDSFNGLNIPGNASQTGEPCSRCGVLRQVARAEVIVNAPAQVRPPAVALIDPKYPHNVGAALRACSCWGIGQLWWTGRRVTLDVPRGQRLPREERMKGYRAVELHHEDRVFDCLGAGPVTPVAVELRPLAESLVSFEHPEQALYVFGPEDGSLPKPVRLLCHRFVVIPTHHCLNLAAAVNVVLYDRRLKRQQSGRETMLPVREMLREHRGPVGGADRHASDRAGVV